MPEDTIEGVVVGRTDVGEADRIVRLLTAEHGRVDLGARGARRSKRRFAGAFEPGVRLRVKRRKARGEGLSWISSADILTAPRRAREDFARLMYLTYGCELVGALSDEGIASTRLSKLLEVWLDCLESDRPPDAASRLALEGKALTFAGLAPALTQCPVCREGLTGQVVFDADAGGGVHPWCGNGASLTSESLAVLEALRRTPLRETPGRIFPESVRWVLARFIEYQVRAGLRSRSLVETMEVP